jgi:hypothetical protein
MRLTLSSQKSLFQSHFQADHPLFLGEQLLALNRR